MGVRFDIVTFEISNTILFPSSGDLGVHEVIGFLSILYIFPWSLSGTR